MIYRTLICVRKVYDVQHNCDACGKSKGSKYILFTIDSGSILRCNGYYCFECIPGQVSHYQQDRFDTIPYIFVTKLLKLNKILKRDNNVEDAIKLISTNSKKIKTIKRVR